MGGWQNHRGKRLDPILPPGTRKPHGHDAVLCYRQAVLQELLLGRENLRCEGEVFEVDIGQKLSFS